MDSFIRLETDSLGSTIDDYEVACGHLLQSSAKTIFGMKSYDHTIRMACLRNTAIHHGIESSGVIGVIKQNAISLRTKLRPICCKGDFLCHRCRKPIFNCCDPQFNIAGNIFNKKDFAFSFVFPKFLQQEPDTCFYCISTTVADKFFYY